MNIEVVYKTVYGKKRFYPESKDAIALTKLIGKPTMSLEHLQICKDNGWNVTIKTQSYDLDEYIKNNG